MKLTPSDLFDLAAGPMLSPEQRRRLAMAPKKTGHAWTPGTGPEGETCGSCKHLHRNVMAKVYLKCALMRAQWTAGGGTDVRARDAACKKWEVK
jgi:hypothetical protein